MQELTIISGKGGTGKTSLVAAFAALAEQAIVVDCDVDAPDLHLVLQPTVLRKREFIGGKTAHINQTRCVACGQCQDVCRYDAVLTDDAVLVDHQPTCTVDSVSCEGCGVCAEICPARAIQMVPAVNGEWYVSQTRHGPMVHARLGVAQENSGKLVSLLRHEARALAEREGRELVICDGPPGIGCPVIATLGSTTLVLIVIEPTVSGLHDFKRVVQLTQHFGVPAAACINKSDLNERIAEQLAAEALQSGLEVLGRIPYDKAVVAAQMQLTSVVEFGDGAASAAVRQVWNEARARLDRDKPARRTANATR